MAAKDIVFNIHIPGNSTVSPGIGRRRVQEKHDNAVKIR